MAERHYEIERTMTKPSAGGTVTPTTTGESSAKDKNINNEYIDKDDGCAIGRASPTSRTESKTVALRKRRRTEVVTPTPAGIPRKAPRRTGDKASERYPPNEDAPEHLPEELARQVVKNDLTNLPASLAGVSSSFASADQASTEIEENAFEARKSCKRKQERRNSDYLELPKKFNEFIEEPRNFVIDDEHNEMNKDTKDSPSRNSVDNPAEQDVKDEVEKLSKKPPMHPDLPSRLRLLSSGGGNRRDDTTRLRKTIQWLEEGARKLREDLAETRAELHEERRAAKLAKREIEVAAREARAAENAKQHRVIVELKTRLSQSPSRTTIEPSLAMSAKAEFLKDENHRREISALKKRLAEAEATIRKLRSSSLDPPAEWSNGKRRRIETRVDASELKKLDNEVRSLRVANKKLDERLSMVFTEAEKIRIMELRIQHDNHETELNALKKSFRTDIIRMMDEIRNKDREIERLGKLARENRKRSKEDDMMRKLRENDNGHQIRLAARIEDKIPQVENVIDLCKGECEAVAEVERLRELAIEQQDVIEILRQAVKEKERKLDQLSNKKRKEEFYKQWLELEPVAEVDDEDEHEEGDSALSSAPSSLSPQPGGCGQWQNSGVTREAYEAVLLEVDELQTKFLEEQNELAHAKSQVRDLEKALLQETRGSQNSRRVLSEKLCKIEEREANLIAEIAELREQNELLEFRVLELEESPVSRETPDTADSGIVSPEPMHIFQQQTTQNVKTRDRAIATVLPFSSYTHPASPIVLQKPPLSLQESGIFEEDENDEENEETAEEAEQDGITQMNREVELTSCGTQTEAPVGELLQEVQRLQELRERIQERAVKAPSSPILEVKSSSGSTLDRNVSEESESYREKIRQLEQRLASFVEEEDNRKIKDSIVKQREEDLLDENYRLTERVYWLENEFRSLESNKKIHADVETMTEPNTRQCHVETMTEVGTGAFLNAETMTDTMIETNFTPKFIEKLEEENKEMESVLSAEISTNSRCEKMFRTALQVNLDRESSKSTRMELDDSRVEGKLDKAARSDECPDCRTLRKDYDEKIQQLAKAECRFRGRLIDLERKEGAFAKTLKQVDVTWSQLEANHAMKLEEIGRRLEEKVESNRRMMERVAELEKTKNTLQIKESSGSFSSGISSVTCSIPDEDFAGMDQVDKVKSQEMVTMDVDADAEEDSDEKFEEAISDVSQGTQTDRYRCSSCWANENDESLRAIPMSEMQKTSGHAPTLDGTEIAVEAKEDTDEKSDAISRVRVMPQDERPAPEPTGNLGVTINETELDKKVRECRRNERVGWEGKGWNTESYKLNGHGERKTSNQANNKTDSEKYIFKHRKLHYVLYPEICV